MNVIRARFVVMVGCSLVAVGASAAHAGDKVPVRGRITGTISFTQLSLIPPVFDIQGDGTGSVSHLGHVNGSVAFPGVELDLGTGEVHLSETTWFITVAAANGDEIHASYTLPMDTYQIDSDGNLVYVAELFVLGGTGRFEGATGSGCVIAVANVPNATFTADIAGELYTVGSSKKSS